MTRMKAMLLFLVLLFQATISMGETVNFPTTMQPGFNAVEAHQMLDIAAMLNGLGVQNATTPDVTKTWTQRAEGKNPSNASAEYGYGPFNGRWQLWQLGEKNIYVISVRGTIYDMNSIEEDVMTNPLQAERIILPTKDNQKTIRFRLASTSYRQVDESKDFPRPEVHAGFAYGMASILFDEQYGLLKALKNVPPGSQVYVTGHSQGAAIATLLHSFLHYACADTGYAAILDEDRGNYQDCAKFGLEGKNWQVKSYVFAQPKPGNWRYAMDLAQIAGNRGMFYTINNYDDPVTQVPLAFQLLTDTLTQQEIDSLDGRHRVLGALEKMAGWFRREISNSVDEAELDKHLSKAAQIDPSYANGDVKNRTSGGASLNFTPCGNVIAVRARKQDNAEYLNYTKETDFLREHHLWRYNQLAKYWPQG